MDNQVYFLKNNILSLFNSFIPLKKVTSIENRLLFNSFIQKCIDERDLAYFRWKRFKTKTLHDTFKTLRNKVNIQIKRSTMK